MTPLREIIARAIIDDAGLSDDLLPLGLHRADAILAALRDAGFSVRSDAEIAAAVAQARREGIEAAAALVECCCPAEQRAIVTSVPPNSAARWNACGQPNCAAIDAAAIRALLPAPDAALLRDFTAWTEARAMSDPAIRAALDAAVETSGMADAGIGGDGEPYDKQVIAAATAAFLRALAQNDAGPMLHNGEDYRDLAAAVEAAAHDR